MRKPSPIERVADVLKTPATYVSIHQREVDHVFVGVEWISAGLMHVQQGQKVLRAGEQEVSVNAGELVWIAPGTRLDVRNVPSGGDYRAEGMLIDPSVLLELRARRPVSTERFRRIRAKEAPRLMEAHRRCVEALSDSLPTEVVRFRLLEVLAWVVELGIDVSPGTSTRLAVKRLFTSAPGRAWKLSEVAKSLAMSEDTLHRKLTREKSGFQQLLTEVRMDHAVSLLWSTDLSLGHIAYEVGYTSQSRFAERFHQRFGLLPLGLRARR